MEKTVKIYNSFEEAEKAEIEFWQNASYDEKFKTLEAIQLLTFKPLYPDIRGIEKVVKFRMLGEEE